MNFSLEGKVALVTGSTRGIGCAIARGFAAAGARVWVHGRDEEAARRLSREIGGRFVQADLEQSDAVNRMVAVIQAEEEHLDVLVNNAGMESAMTVERMDMEACRKTMRVNTEAAVELTHGLFPLFKKSEGASIINITSIHDFAPYPNYTPYAMSKAALAMFTKTACLELSPLGIRINNLAPGAVETDINRAEIEAVGRDLFREWIPLGRVAQCEDLIGPALFLASDASRYVTGTTLYVDGGYMQNLVRYRPRTQP